MIIDGIKLTFVGMGTVFFFLVLLIAIIIGISKIIAPYVHLFEDNPRKATKGPVRTSTSENKQLVAAVISAAVYKYRKRKG